jgi:predicted transcriptional regulator
MIENLARLLNEEARLFVSIEALKFLSDGQQRSFQQIMDHLTEAGLINDSDEYPGTNDTVHEMIVGAYVEMLSHNGFTMVTSKRKHVRKNTLLQITEIGLLFLQKVQDAENQSMAQNFPG